jgi:RNA recognition motif-containing protein
MFTKLFQAIGRLFGSKDKSYYPMNAISTDTRLYVGNLSYSAKEEDMEKLFSKYGRVRNINIVRDRVTRRLKGYAFVEMSKDDAAKAMALSGTEFLGRKIVVSEAKVKRQEHRSERSENTSHSNGNASTGQSQAGPGPRRPRNNFRRRRGAGPRSNGYKGTEKPSIPRYE